MFKRIAKFKKNNNLNLLELLFKFTRYPLHFSKMLLGFSLRPSTSYEKWIKIHEKQNFEKNNIINGPFFSIVIPTYNSNPIFLKECINSVLEQTYSNFEICIADDCSTNQKTIETLKKFNSNKIKIAFREKNGNISEATNSAISLCRGDYIVFLDHDDKLSRNALYEVAKIISEKSEIKFIYSDEDHIDKKGRRYSPHFKSDFNEYLLYSQNYICHLVVVETKLIRKIHGMRIGYEGSQDHDLILRVISQINENQIYHIPKILYHWRQYKESFSREYLSQCVQSSLNALRDHFREKGEDVKISEGGLLPSIYKIEYPITIEPKVSLIIPMEGKVEILKKCITNILSKTNYQDYEIIIIKNNSPSEEAISYFEEIKKNKKFKILDLPNLDNQAAINNFAVSNSKGKIIGFLNNYLDVVSPDWLTEMVCFAQKKNIGCVGAKLYYLNETIQHGGIILNSEKVGAYSHRHFKRTLNGYAGRLKSIQNLSAVSGACLVIKKSLFLKLGGLDEKNLKNTFYDIDLCLKSLQAGYKNIWNPYAELYCDKMSSCNSNNGDEKEYMIKKWGEYLKRDPMYNPNLTQVKENFSLNI